MKLLAVLLNWRTADMTLRALDALVPEVRAIPSARICIVDNDSRDGSFAKLQEGVRLRGLEELVDVVDSGHNGGYGFGNNVGIRRAIAAGAQYVYLLNSDAFPDAGAVSELVKYLDAHPEAGISGSYTHGTDGTPHQTAFRFPTLWSEVDRGLRLGPVSRALKDRLVPMEVPDHTLEVDWLAGASMLLRTSMLEQIGLFDETFFLYYEETDLCLRAQRAGWRIAYVRSSSIAHIGSATTGMKDNRKPMPTYMFASRRHYLLKNHGRAYLWACNAAYAATAMSFRARRIVQRKADEDRPGELADFIRHSLTHP
jgi:N-acetylglucosaminyl-diphospho-decaprenol L-rhamnosyltransferase